jgi:adenosylcobinamide-GDP ribazoletransferase
MTGLMTALRAMTVLRDPDPEPGAISASLAWFPVSGALIGCVVWGALAATMACSHNWAGGSAAVALLVGLWITGGKPLLDLAHAADGLGLGAAGPGEYTAIKEAHLRPAGALALVVALLIRWLALARLADVGAAVMIVVACAVARASIVELAGSLRFAREGRGVSEAIVEGADASHSLSAMGVAFAVSLLFAGTIGVAACVLGWLCAVLFANYLSRAIGGVTEELLGACSETVETLLLLLAAICAVWIPALSVGFWGVH